MAEATATDPVSIIVSPTTMDTAKKTFKKVEENEKKEKGAQTRAPGLWPCYSQGSNH